MAAEDEKETNEDEGNYLEGVAVFEFSKVQDEEESEAEKERVDGAAGESEEKRA